MAAGTVRVGERTRRRLKELSKELGKPMTEVLRQALEMYRRSMIIAEANRAWAILKADPEAWNDELAERAAWDSTLGDGQED